MFGKDEKAGTLLAENTIMGNFQITTQLPNGRSIVMSGYLIHGESQESLNGKLDQLQEVMERQRLRCEVPVLEHAREMIVQQTVDLQAAMKGQEDALAKLKERELQGKKLTSSEKMHMNTLQQQLGNMETSVKANEKKLADADKSIADAKRKAGMEKAA